MAERGAALPEGTPGSGEVAVVVVRRAACEGLKVFQRNAELTCEPLRGGIAVDVIEALA